MALSSARGRRNVAGMLEGLESRVMLTTAAFVEGYSFTGGSDGGAPRAIVVDGSANLFGTTGAGGGNGVGTFFGIGAGGTVAATPTVLGNLDQTDAMGVVDDLVVDGAGNVFGTSVGGGTGSNGSIFEVSALTRTPTVIFSFPFGSGVAPSPTLTVDAAGDLFGTTVSGGANGDGQVFEISAGNHNFSTVYSFLGTDGRPGPVVVDGSGNIFGVTTTGGGNGSGEVFEILAGKHSVAPLASLPAGVGVPSLAIDGNGNLFGTTQTGGTAGAGTIFEYRTASQSLVTLYNFAGNAAQSFPNAHIVVDASDDVLGTTGNSGDQGVAFELQAGAGTIAILHTFVQSTPAYGLVAGPAGVLYGVTSDGGADGEGSLFSMTVNNTPPATQLAFGTGPASGAAGNLGTITVKVEDANGDVVTTDNSRVTLKVLTGPTGAKVSGTVTATAVKGVATFKKAALTEAGTYTLEATDGVLTAATTGSFTLGASAATHVVFVQQPGATVAGAAGAVMTVKVEDKNNNVVTTDSSTVTLGLASKPAGGVFAGGTTSVAAVNGVATFSGLVLDVAGTYTLLATDGALKSGKSKSFVVSADAGTAHLVITQTPAGTAVVGKPLTALTVTLKDQFGNVVKGNKSSVVVSAASGPAGAKISGTVSASISSGTATFKKVTVNTAGTFVLQAADGALADGANVPVTFGETITPGVTSVGVVKPAKSYASGATIVLHTTLKSTAPAGIPFSGTATVTDSLGDVLGNVTVSAKGAVAATISGLGAGTYACTLTYAGDADHTPAGSAGFVLVVNAAVA